MNSSYLRVNEVVAALKQLGGEAEWRDIEALVTSKRGGSYLPYKDRVTFQTTMFQLVQKRCKGYRKFAGRVMFERVRGRFRLARKPPDHPVPPSPPRPRSYNRIVEDAARFKSGGEGREHRRLKEFIASHPQVVGLPKGLRGELEYCLPSGDRADVLFKNAGAWIAVEVKASNSPEEDVARGIFQCIKYQAVVEALQTSGELPPDARAILVLTAPLPERLIRLKDMLEVDVIDQVTRP